MGAPMPVSRRSVLRGVLVGSAGAGGLTVALSGCGVSSAGDPAIPPGDSGGSTGSSDSTSAPADHDVAIVASAIADERAILVFCTRLAASGPDRPAALVEVATSQRRHVGALRAALTDAAPDHVGHVPRRHAGAAGDLATLRSLLSKAQHARRSDALAAESGPLARLLASMSASHAVAASLDGLGG